MGNERMREEFERTNARDHRRFPPKGNNYIDPHAQLDWEAFKKGWRQSRESLVIELPKSYELFGGSVSATVMYPDEVRAAIESLGLKVKQ